MYSRMPLPIEDDPLMSAVPAEDQIEYYTLELVGDQLETMGRAGRAGWIAVGKVGTGPSGGELWLLWRRKRFINLPPGGRYRVGN